MRSDKSNPYEYETLRTPGKAAGGSEDLSTLRPMNSPRPDKPKPEEQKAPPPVLLELPTITPEEIADPEPISPKKAKKKQKDLNLFKSDHWLARNGHFATYIGLFLFSIMVLFRPYEIVPGLGFLASAAIYFAVATMAVFIPSQLVTEGNLTTLSTEVKAVFAMTLIAFALIPISRDPVLAWNVFNDTYIKAIMMFIVMVNVLRTRRRLMGLMWLSFGIGIYLSIDTIRLYLAGDFAYEGYRVGITDTQGMFGNPNEMALHLVMMTPILISLCIASKKLIMKAVYLGAAVIFVTANVLTFSRGGFLGLLISSLVLAWKLGRRNRLNVSLASLAIAGFVIIAAPGNYGLRLLSIVFPSLDPVGSADARREGLITSLIVTARNPWGIGMGNSAMFGAHNLQTHNAYTQVSSELGLMGLAAYLVLMISPFRKLGAIERELFEKNQIDWFYYVSIGLQGGIIAYMVSSFFASVAYNWFVYYLIAYAVAFRRVYGIEKNKEEEVASEPSMTLQPAASR